MQLPSIRQLSFLVALADKGSFVAAAASTFITQPSLSAGIKELETILGTQLIERNRKGIKFTPAGLEAVAHAKSIIRSAIELKEQVRSASEPLTGSFRLGIIPTIAPFLASDAVPIIKEKFPKLKLYLREEQTKRVLESLKNHELDAAIIALPYEVKGIETLAIFDDEFIYISPKSDTKKITKPEDIDTSRLLLLEDGHCLRDHALNICRNENHGNDEIRATSLFTLIQMVAGGMGVSLIPKLAIDGGMPLDGVEIQHFSPPVIGRQIGIAWRKGSSRINEAKTLAHILCPQSIL